jgi:hypothetical protein
VTFIFSSVFVVRLFSFPVLVTLNRKILKIPRAGGVAQLIELSKHEALNSNSNTAKKILYGYFSLIYR